MRRGGRRRGSGGYVMIEALAALAVAGLVLATVPVISGMMIRGWQGATRNSDTLDMMSSGLAVVRREVTEIRRAWLKELAGEQERGEARVAFLGTPETLGFVIGGGRASPDPEPRFVTLAAHPDTAGMALMHGSVPFRPDMTMLGTEPMENPVVLLKGPFRYKFNYAAAKAGSLQWQETWQRTDAMPVAIRLDVLSQATGERVVPPMVVPIRANVDLGCLSARAGPCSE